MTAVPLALPPPELQRGQLLLHAVTDADWPVEQQLSRCAEVVRWTSYATAITESQARARVARQQERARDGATQRYVITEAGSPVGTCGLGRLDQPSPEAMYALLPEARGRGIATRALRTLADWAEGNRRPSVVLVTVDGNGPSVAVARRAGFVHEETFEGQHRGTTTTLHRWRRTPGHA